MKWIFRILFKLKGWKLDPQHPPGIDRCMLLCVPHTSNWDFILGMAGVELLGITVRFTIKKEWMIFPFRLLLRSLGAVSIDRSPKDPQSPRKSSVEAMAELFATREKLSLIITPEGTRSLRTKWKTGFYYTAKKAGIPIALGYLNYETKTAGIGKMVVPSGDFEKDMREIMEFYKGCFPRFPEKFSLDVDYI